MNQITQALDLRMLIANQDRNGPDSAHTVEEMDTLSCTAEPNLSMIRLKDNRDGTTKSAKQSSLMITIDEEDRILGLRKINISISNPDTETKTTRHPTDRLASTQSDRNPNSDRQYQQNRSSNSWNNGPNNRQQTQYNFNARPENSDTQYNRNFPQSNNLPTPNSVQFIEDQGQVVTNTLSGFFPLNF